MARHRPDPPRASLLHAIGEGWRRTLSAWTLVAAVLATTLVAAWPFGLLLSPDTWRWERVLEAQDTLVDPVLHTHSGRNVGVTMATRIVYIAGGDRSIDVQWSLLYPGAILLWLFLLGGILDRLARDRPIRTASFFAACGVYFFRFLRLALPVALIYWAFQQWLIAAVADLAARWPDAWHVILVAVVAAIDAVAHIAAVRMVVEDRRSAIGAWMAAIRFVVRRPARVGGLYLVNWLIGLALFSAWFRLVPPGTDASALALASATVVMAVRLIARLAWLASEIVLFQESLAHAGYTASPPAVWPDSASVEAIRNLTR